MKTTRPFGVSRFISRFATLKLPPTQAMTPIIAITSPIMVKIEKFGILTRKSLFFLQRIYYKTLLISLTSAKGMSQVLS
ncbi:MAG: hypothetical protein KME57_04425 [Scytonema hyalinum WJT4-NPBG1]|nr:hypothetical protein [Scytonema hyalinum WJT4-NPBG1]